MGIKKEVIIGDCRLLLGDCLEIMPLLGKVDAVVTDPPYNISELGGGGFGKRAMYSGNKIDKWCDFDVSATLPIILNTQLSKNGFYFCSRLGIQKYLIIAAELELNYDVLCWYKPNAIPFTNGTMKQDLEYIIRLYDVGARIVKGNKQHEYSKMFNFPIDSDPDKEHPTKKPLPIIERLCRLISEAGQTILDPFMGSGTTGVACAKMGRKFVGIELDEGYFDVACKRVQAVYDSPDLFVEPPKKAIQDSLEF